jgi:hypothetical protein
MKGDAALKHLTNMPLTPGTEVFGDYVYNHQSNLQGVIIDA